MEETIKGVEVIAYKGMELNMTCLGFQYEVGKTYKNDNIELSECGFHACLNPIDVLDYYEQGEGSRYFKVKLSGEITKCDKSDTKVAATEITILEEITDIFDEVIETTEWWKNNNVLDLLPWSEGFAKIQRADGLWNFIDKQGNILLNEWFRYVWPFNKGFAKVQRTSDSLLNFIDKQGNYLFNKWFKHLGDFNDDFATIEREDGLRNFIDKKGHYLSEEWFEYVERFKNSLARVKRIKDHLWNFINVDGHYLCNDWFTMLTDFFNNKLSFVRRLDDRLFNFINKNGNYVSDEWFLLSYPFLNEVGIVQKMDGMFYLITSDGKVLDDKPFKDVSEYSFDFARVQRIEDELWNFIDKNGNYLSDEWFTKVWNFTSDFAKVQRTNGEYCKIDKFGKLLES